MSSSPASPFGQCPCGGTYEPRSVVVRIPRGDDQLEISDVAQGACPVCRSRVYKAAILDCLEALWGNRSLTP